MQSSPSTLFDFQRIARLALYVIVRPADYFRTMPRGGPLGEPLVFMTVLSLVGAVMMAFIALLMTGQLPLLAGVLMVPALACGAGLLMALVLMLLWRMMGSRQDYATAFRCVAATTAIVPVTALLAPWTQLSLLVNALWSIYLLYVASVQVHGLGRARALGVTALLAAVVGMGLWSNHSLNQLMQQERERLGVSEQAYEQLSPQERTLLDQRVIEALRQR